MDIPELDVGGRNRAANCKPERLRVYPRLSGAATNEGRTFAVRNDGKPKRRRTCARPEGGPPQADCVFATYTYLDGMTVQFPFQNTYATLPDGFFARVAPTPVTSPRLIKLNRPLASRLRLDPDRLESPEGAEILAGKRVPMGAEP